MTKQPTDDSFNLAPSLQAKLQAFAEGLTREESEQLHALQTEDVTGMLSASLREKAQRAADGLTEEEQAQLRLLVERTGVSAAAGEEVDTHGYMKRLDVELDTHDQLGGGGGFFTGSLTNLGTIAVGIAVIGAMALNSGPAPSPQS